MVASVGDGSRPNPNYYGTQPTLQEIRYHIGGDPAASQPAFEAGEYDMLKAPPDQVPTIMENPELGPITKPVVSTVFDYWGFDSSSEETSKASPTRSARPQQALPARAGHGHRQGHALRRPTAVRVRSRVAVMPPGVLGHQPDIGLKYDVEAAKAELATALQELGVSDVSELPGAVLRLQHRGRP